MLETTEPLSAEVPEDDTEQSHLPPELEPVTDTLSFSSLGSLCYSSYCYPNSP